MEQRAAVAEDAAAVAREAVHAGAAVLAERFDALETDLAAEFSATDVKADADVATEEAIVPVLREAFPEHALDSEEAGVVTPTVQPAPDDPHYRWIVDPLDGTNNFASGIPTFATAVALERYGPDAGGAPDDGGTPEAVGTPDDSDTPDTFVEPAEAAPRGDPVLAAAAIPATGERYLAVRGEGLAYDGATVSAGSDLSLAAATVATVVGREVAADEARYAAARELFDAVGAGCKRSLDAWAPVVHWGLLGRGLVDVVIAVDPNAEEQVLGDLFARESGAAIHRGEDCYVAAASESLLAEVRDALPADADEAQPERSD